MALHVFLRQKISAFKTNRDFAVAAKAGGASSLMTTPIQHGAHPELSILIVAYNSAGFIADCIASIVEHTSAGSYEILLVDNGKDGTEALVRDRFPQVRIVPSQGNIGFGRGNNLLAGHARGRFLLLLNPDTRLVDHAVDRLLEFARSKPAGAWGGLTMYPDGRLDGGNFLTIPTLKGLIRESFFGLQAGSREAALEQLTAPQQVSVLCGGFMMISREAWNAIDGFDPTFLLYAEELDLFTRLKAAGYEVWLTPDSRIVHDVGSGNPDSPGRLLYSSTGRMHYARRHWPFPGAQLAGFALWLTMVRRWAASGLIGLASARHRARRKAYDRIVLNPGCWWRGYEGRNSLE
ncbi:MAG: hypothetical protein B7X90_07065 [Novosphingobium sp. 17-62-19]|nr:MAG: hypothetical protein B7Y74_04540 [Novosphingobium sp. 35-62-5]OZA20097.1 MAG: hypothetical protein B7X90_07065 [Novosphingobium sp. 17-62-19]